MWQTKEMGCGVLWNGYYMLTFLQQTTASRRVIQMGFTHWRAASRRYAE